MPSRSPVRDERAALDHMRCPEYIGSQWHRDSVWWSRRPELHPDLVGFGRRLCSDFAKLHIPLWVSCYPLDGGDRLHVSHCILGDDLPELCWLMIGHRGLELLGQLGLKGRWSLLTPLEWELYDLAPDASEALGDAQGEADGSGAELAYLF